MGDDRERDDDSFYDSFEDVSTDLDSTNNNDEVVAAAGGAMVDVNVNTVLSLEAEEEEEEVEFLANTSVAAVLNEEGDVEVVEDPISAEEGVVDTVNVHIKIGSMGRFCYKGMEWLHDQTCRFPIHATWEEAIHQEFGKTLDPEQFFVRWTFCTSTKHNLLEPIIQLLEGITAPPAENEPYSVNIMRWGGRGQKRTTSTNPQRRTKRKRKEVDYSEPEDEEDADADDEFDYYEASLNALDLSSKEHYAEETTRGKSNGRVSSARTAGIKWGSNIAEANKRGRDAENTSTLNGTTQAFRNRNTSLPIYLRNTGAYGNGDPERSALGSVPRNVNPYDYVDEDSDVVSVSSAEDMSEELRLRRRFLNRVQCLTNGQLLQARHALLELKESETSAERGSNEWIKFAFACPFAVTVLRNLLDV